MKALYKTAIAVIVGALAMLSVFTSVAGQAATGTVSVQVVYCPQLNYPAELPGMPENCHPGPAQFSFYLVGDGTADYESLSVPETGTASIDLPAGEYEVWEENTQVKLSVFVTEGQTTSFVFGFPSESGPDTPSADFYISAWACTSVSDVAFMSTVPGDCVRIATDLSFYLVGDGTNLFYPVPTLASGAMLTSLPHGDYEVVAEATQTHLPLTVNDEMGDVHIVFPKAADPVTPTPAPTTSAQPTAAPKPTAATVTKLPSTGSGTENDAATLGLIAAGAVLIFGAAGLRLRKS